MNEKEGMNSVRGFARMHARNELHPTSTCLQFTLISNDQYVQIIHGIIIYC